MTVVEVSLKRAVVRVCSRSSTALVVPYTPQPTLLLFMCTFVDKEQVLASHGQLQLGVPHAPHAFEEREDKQPGLAVPKQCAKLQGRE